MADIKIENVVASTQIAKSLDLNKLAEIIPNSRYNPQEIPALIIHFEKPKTVAMLSSKGKVVFTGLKTMKDAHEITENIRKKLNSLGIKVYKRPDLKIQNIVASTDIKKNLNLKSIARSLENAEYDPKHFLGLVYKTDDHDTILLLFNSGKIVCNGSEPEKISTALDKMTNELSSLGIL
ncbi:MAG: TATA-box-binding protein [Thermoplasmatales archaeon]|nr:MAG: TATA-box-binding protein [Thermoplasmatales archaeon]